MAVCVALRSSVGGVGTRREFSAFEARIGATHFRCGVRPGGGKVHV
jgi:hypothetical protein